MLTDTRVIARAGAHDVLAHRHEVLFVDGHAVWLHRVRRAGMLHRSLRTLATDSGCHLLFDLATLSAQLDASLCVAQERDHPGTVLYSLRRTYATKPAFVVDVRKHCLSAIEPELQAP